MKLGLPDEVAGATAGFGREVTMESTEESTHEESMTWTINSSIKVSVLAASRPSLSFPLFLTHHPLVLPVAALFLLPSVPDLPPSCSRFLTYHPLVFLIYHPLVLCSLLNTLLSSLSLLDSLFPTVPHLQPSGSPTVG